MGTDLRGDPSDCMYSVRSAPSLFSKLGEKSPSSPPFQAGPRPGHAVWQVFTTDLGTSKLFTEGNLLLPLESRPLQWKPYRFRSLLSPVSDVPSPSPRPSHFPSQDTDHRKHCLFFQKKFPLQPGSRLHPLRSNYLHCSSKGLGHSLPGEGYTKASTAHIQSPSASLG